MADPNTIYKMTVLSMLDTVDAPLSNTQIANFFLEQDYTDYFTVQRILSDLLDSGLLRPKISRRNTLYLLTSLGRETLDFFSDKITPGIKEDIAAYFEKNKLKLKDKNSVTADFYKSTTAGYNVRCLLRENNRSMIDLTIHVPTKTQAEVICANWQKQHIEVYTYLMDMLIK